MVRYPDGRVVHFVTCLFACRAASSHVRGNAEGISWVWFDPAALPDDLLPYARRWLTDAFTGEPLPRVR